MSKANEKKPKTAGKTDDEQLLVSTEAHARDSRLRPTALDGASTADETTEAEAADAMPEDGAIERALRRKAMDGNVSATQLLWKMGCLEQRKDQYAARFLLELVELLLSRKDLCQPKSCGNDE